MSETTHLIRLAPRPERIYVSQGRSVLAIGSDGFISEGTDQGLFVHETRVLSQYRYLINGRPFASSAFSNIEQHSWLGYFIAAVPGVKDESDFGSGKVAGISQQTIELRAFRYVGFGMHEDLDLTNFTQNAVAFEFALDLDADFADQIEVKEGRKQFGELKREWREVGKGVHQLVWDYTASHTYHHQGSSGSAAIHRGLVVRVENSSSIPSERDGQIVFEVRLAPKQGWHCCVNFIPSFEGEPMEPIYSCGSEGNAFFDNRRKLFFAESTLFDAPRCHNRSQLVVDALEQAKRDLAALRLYDLDHSERVWIMAAGIPVYVALFGRDVLTASWQAAPLSTAMMQEAVAELARWTGRTINHWRDEQPGRMLHEAHTGPLEKLQFNPRARYYGSITTPTFYPVVLSELWHWTGQPEFVKPFIEPALEALRWLDRDADLNGDGFYEYKSLSSQGVQNQGWKDSGDAIVYEDGSQVHPPIANCEAQGFAYAAKMQLSEVLWWLGDRHEARKLWRQASELKKRFNQAFWMEDQGYFAMGLDSRRRQIRSIGSDPGHCLATGIADRSLARRLADRLFAPDLFSGWGIRTLSAEHPAYNPYSYHRGTVWPVEQGTFAIGFMRYGLWDCVERIASAQFDAAALFEYYRLPELFSGHPRDEEHPFPALYPQCNSPQAWSSSSLFSHIQALLGLYPYAPAHLLFIDPHLPEWLPELRLSGLRVGSARITIRFYRNASGSTSFTIEKLDGRLHVIKQPSPWSITAGFGERIADIGTSLLPASNRAKMAAGLAGVAAAGALGWWSLKRR